MKVYITKVLDQFIILFFYNIIFILNSITYPKELKKCITSPKRISGINLPLVYFGIHIHDLDLKVMTLPKNMNKQHKSH